MAEDYVSTIVPIYDDPDVTRMPQNGVVMSRERYDALVKQAAELASLKAKVRALVGDTDNRYYEHEYGYDVCIDCGAQDCRDCDSDCDWQALVDAVVIRDATGTKRGEKP